ncbi:MAG: DUF3365 domain-containing protein, partial [Candidatus Electrothrix sp. AUS4]|nr:DUF3365 domain-containing protein [Candidatus Electrothrix sp. AUS4]
MQLKYNKKNHANSVLFFLLTGWTLLLVSLLWWNMVHLKQATLALAESNARIFLEKDMLYRAWNVAHGGVYVPVSQATQPNPYLDIANRDVMIGERKYTLVNPAYMFRQVAGMGEKIAAIQGRITALNPKSPQNKPSPWEKKALISLEQGGKDYLELVKSNGQYYIHFMRPLKAEKACLACHHERVASIGHVVGGIGLVIPMENYFEQHNANIHKLWLAFGVIWSAGIAIICIMNSVIQRNMRKLKQSEQQKSTIL